MRVHEASGANRWFSRMNYCNRYNCVIASDNYIIYGWWPFDCHLFHASKIHQRTTCTGHCLHRVVHFHVASAPPEPARQRWPQTQAAAKQTGKPGNKAQQANNTRAPPPRRMAAEHTARELLILTPRPPLNRTGLPSCDLPGRNRSVMSRESSRPQNSMPYRPRPPIPPAALDHTRTSCDPAILRTRRRQRRGKFWPRRKVGQCGQNCFRQPDFPRSCKTPPA